MLIVLLKRDGKLKTVFKSSRYILSTFVFKCIEAGTADILFLQTTDRQVGRETGEITLIIKLVLEVFWCQCQFSETDCTTGRWNYIAAKIAIRSRQWSHLRNALRNTLLTVWDTNNQSQNWMFQTSFLECRLMHNRQFAVFWNRP